MTSDVIIVGGGLSGLPMAALLAGAGARVTLIDREDPARQLKAEFDGRTTAVSLASKRVLEAAGVWDKMAAHAEPILDIRVADGASPFFLHFASDEGKSGEAFGWIIDNLVMRKILVEHVSKLKNVTYLAPAEIVSFENDGARMNVTLKDGKVCRAPLLIGADGRNSAVRKYLGIDVRDWSYEQSAIVCCAEHELPHENVAVEHFLPDGPFAILPMTNSDKGRNRSSVVWTVPADEADAYIKLPPEKFDALLQEKFGDHLGVVHHVGLRMAYPLRLMHAKRYVGARTALMAEAAHVIHPIAGQGLNLSLRDAALLAELIVDRLRLGLDPASDEMLQRYETDRMVDTHLMGVMTDTLNRLFSNDLQTVSRIREFGLGIVERTTLLKRFFASQAMGLGGKMPRILEEKPL